MKSLPTLAVGVFHRLATADSFQGWPFFCTNRYSLILAPRHQTGFPIWISCEIKL